MNLQTVAENLRNTIASKEKFLEELKLKANRLSWDQYSGGALGYAVAESTVKYLELNLEELKKILADVEQCIADNKEFSTWAHWQDNPDRSGGQFTQDEIDNASAWQ